MESSMTKEITAFWGLLLLLSTVGVLFSGCTDQESQKVASTAETFIDALIQGESSTIRDLLSEPDEAMENGAMSMFTGFQVQSVQQMNHEEYQVQMLMDTEEVQLVFLLTLIKKEELWKVSPEIQVTQNLSVTPSSSE